jgi:phosphocarrier protein
VTLTREYTLLNKYGMHVRPAGALAKLCQKYRADITVQKEGHAVSGKSVLGLMTLEAPCGTVLKITAEGEDAEDALDAIAELVENRFGILDE